MGLCCRQHKRIMWRKDLCGARFGRRMETPLQCRYAPHKSTRRYREEHQVVEGPDSVAGQTRLYQQCRPSVWHFQRTRFSFSSRLGCAEPAAKRVVTDPAGNRQHGKAPELSCEIAHQEMKLLDAALMERNLAGQCDRGETNTKTEEPLLPADQRACAPQRSQFKIRWKRGGRDLAEVVCPLQADALRQLRVLLHVFFDKGTRGRAGLARKIDRQEIEDHFPRNVHFPPPSLTFMIGPAMHFVSQPARDEPGRSSLSLPQEKYPVPARSLRTAFRPPRALAMQPG